MIKYLAKKRVARDKLAALYESVRWLHFRMPEKLQEAYGNSDFVVTAWDGERLVGAGRAITDGCFNAYFPDIAVHPGYHGRGVGREIVSRLLKRCKAFYNVAAVAEDPIAESFFLKCGLTDQKKALRRMIPISG